MPEKERISIICKGRVQGVGFRFMINRHANVLNLKGYVKNLGDGSVQIIAEGEKQDISKLIFYIKEGPGFSSIDDLQVERSHPSGEFSTFSIRH